MGLHMRAFRTRSELRYNMWQVLFLAALSACWGSELTKLVCFLSLLSGWTTYDFLFFHSYNVYFYRICNFCNWIPLDFVTSKRTINSIHLFADIPMEAPGHQTQPQTEMSMKVNENYLLFLRELSPVTHYSKCIS